MIMKTAPDRVNLQNLDQRARPPLLVNSRADWEREKPTIRMALETEIYGIMPKSFESEIRQRREITDHGYADIKIEEIDLSLSYIRKNNEEHTAFYKAVLLTPEKGALKGTEAQEHPIIMMESFCPNHNVIPVKGISKPKNLSFSCDNKGLAGRLITYFFGRYITTPPIELILSKGYGLAVIYPSYIFPDNKQEFETIRALSPDPMHPWGSVGAWAFQFSSLSKALSQIGYETTVAYGHSRYAKAALVAAAYDPSIDGVIAHQSGTGGASLSRQKGGETVESITENYPHWFTPRYSESTLSYDQHHLLALIAPRPILLGNAQRDVWSDPEGAFYAAKAANGVYGTRGLSATSLKDFRPSDDIAFWMRKGTHGVVKEDWPAFLSFMDAHFQ